MAAAPFATAEQVLHEMLSTQGLDPHSPRSLGDTWAVFKEFVKVPFDLRGPDSDGVLYQTGIFSLYGEPEFYISFLRQFEATYDDGDHDHYEQLECEFRYPVTEETQLFEPFEHWWFPDEQQTWEAFVQLVEQRPEFLALRSMRPRAARVAQEAV